ncbi:hypothetical protein J1614_002940 [Plenodomus biglobosus]|nr:hypothetical protein J1614_002940 [Plenodomus biglobosus]
MHGRGREANLRDTVVLLGSLDLLGEHLAFEDGPNAIMVSLERHNFRVLKALLQQNASLASAPSISPNRVEADTFHYPIHHAAYVASRRDDPAALEALEVILNYSPQALSSHDSLGRTPLHIAASGSSPLTALFILDRLPVLLKSKDNYGAEPLHYCESATVCEQLLLRGANANAMDFATKTALCNAVTKGLESVVNMLCKNGAITDLPNSSVYNPLHIAIKRTFHTIASMLIGYGSSPNIVDEQGDSPVHIAAAGSPRHILRMLLASGADPFVLNKKHQSALATAVEHNNTAAVEELSRHSPGLILRPLNIAGTSQGTCSSPLFCIQEHNTMREMMRLLTVTEFEVLDSAGLNVLHSAVLTGNLLLVSALIEKGVNLEIQDRQGNTALMLAIHRPAASKRRSHLDIFKKLADHGASMITKNYAGETAWDIATTEIEDDSYVILTALLKHSKEACGDVSQGSQVKSRVHPAWFGQRQIKQTCGSTLVQLAIHRPDQKLLAALRLRMPALEFKAAENMVRAALPDPLRHYRDAYNSNPSLPFVPGAVPDGLYRTATIPTKPPCDLTVTLNSRVEPVELEDTSFLFLARARSSEQAFIASYPDGPFELSTSKYY